MVETASKSDLNLINLSPKLVNVDLKPKSNTFIIDFGVIKREDYKSSKGYFLTDQINYRLESDSDFTIEGVKASCGCTKPTYKKDSNGYLFTQNHNITLSGIQRFNKFVYLTIKQGKINKTITINITER